MGYNDFYDYGQGTGTSGYQNMGYENPGYQNPGTHQNKTSPENGGYFTNLSTQDYMRTMAERARANVDGTANSMGSYNPFGTEYKNESDGQNRFTDQRSDTAFRDQLKRDAEAEKKRAEKRRKRAEKRRARSANGTGRKLAKRVVAVCACAALFGGVAGGVFYGVAGKKIKALEDRQAQLSTMTPLQTTYTASDGTEDSLSFDVADISEAAMPSVVAITIKAVQEVPNYFGFYQEYEAEGSGSGIIIGQNEKELLIVTNNHVVSGADTVSVAFIDNEVYSAKVKGTDSDNDLAVIEVDLSDISESTLSKIKAASIGNSDELKVGQQVVAIGNALGYGQSVTTGIVSALGRSNNTNATPLIQVDAAINPGNSGGALLNMQGELIGINSSKYASTDVEGMGYAIPISQVENIIDDLKNIETREQVSDSERGYLGINCGTVSEEISEMYGMPKGVLVSAVGKDSGADKAGIKKNDVITKIDGQSVKSVDELTERVSTYKEGEKVKVTYETLEGNEYVEKTVNVTLTDKPTEFN